MSLWNNAGASWSPKCITVKWYKLIMLERQYFHGWLLIRGPANIICSSIVARYLASHPKSPYQVIYPWHWVAIELGDSTEKFEIHTIKLFLSLGLLACTIQSLMIQSPVCLIPSTSVFGTSWIYSGIQYCFWWIGMSDFTLIACWVKGVFLGLQSTFIQNLSDVACGKHML